MADYVIGDVQGCYDPLLRLLDTVDFDDRRDRLWFVGDLVNRGPNSLGVLRFVKQLSVLPRVTLGNHDLHLLARLYGSGIRPSHDDTLEDILDAPDREELGHWLRQQSILYHDPLLQVVMCHAGIAPCWGLSEAKVYASELESVLRGPDYHGFLTHMYGNEPNYWSDEWSGMTRWRVLCNYFTRMRCCDASGHLMLSFHGGLDDLSEGMYPWYETPGRQPIDVDIVFGHWAALQGRCSNPHVYALDTGCFWGGRLTALRLQDRQRFDVAAEA